MALSEEFKKRIKKICLLLEKAEELAEDTPSDYRALDCISIAISLFTQQLEMNMEFYETPHDMEESIMKEAVATQADESDEETGDEEPAKVSKADSEAINAIIQDLELTSLDDAEFRFIENSDSPSVDDLNSWFGLPSPEKE